MEGYGDYEEEAMGGGREQGGGLRGSGVSWSGGSKTEELLLGMNVDDYAYENKRLRQMMTRSLDPLGVESISSKSVPLYTTDMMTSTPKVMTMRMPGEETGGVSETYVDEAGGGYPAGGVDYYSAGGLMGYVNEGIDYVYDGIGGTFSSYLGKPEPSYFRKDVEQVVVEQDESSLFNPDHRNSENAEIEVEGESKNLGVYFGAEKSGVHSSSPPESPEQHLGSPHIQPWLLPNILGPADRPWTGTPMPERRNSGVGGGRRLAKSKPAWLELKTDGGDEAFRNTLDSDGGFESSSPSEKRKYSPGSMAIDRLVEFRLSTEQIQAIHSIYWIDGGASITIPLSSQLPFRCAYSMGWALRIVGQMGSEKSGTISHRQSKCSGVLLCQSCGYAARPYVAKVHRSNRRECRGACHDAGRVVELEHVDCNVKICWSRDRDSNIVVSCDRMHMHCRPPALKQLGLSSSSDMQESDLFDPEFVGARRSSFSPLNDSGSSHSSRSSSPRLRTRSKKK